MVFNWQLVPITNLGQSPVATIPISIKSYKGVFVKIVFVIDSGSPITVVRKSVGLSLVSDYLSGKEVTLFGIGGTPVKFYQHNLKITFSGKSSSLDIFVSERDDHSNLFGRLDMFSKFLTTFNPETKSTKIELLEIY